jgi:Family of unknown function (DUF5908)
MPVKVNEFIIQARIDNEETETTKELHLGDHEIQLLKEEIISSCMEKLDAILEKREAR